MVGAGTEAGSAIVLLVVLLPLGDLALESPDLTADPARVPTVGRELEEPLVRIEGTLVVVRLLPKDPEGQVCVRELGIGEGRLVRQRQRGGDVPCSNMMFA